MIRVGTLLTVLAGTCAGLLWSPLASGLAVAARTGVSLAANSVPAGPDSAHPPTITWSTGNGSPGSVTVSISRGAEQLFAWGPEGSATASWLSKRTSYVLRLYSDAPSKRLLATLRQGSAPAQIVGSPAAPTLTPGFVNRLLQLTNFAALALVLVLAGRWGREALRRV